MSLQRQVLYISHGGGPLPLLGDAGHQALVAQLQQMAQRIERPQAIIVFSAHWEAPKVTITAGAQPDLIYDYSGFPAESYRIEYPAPGAPELAEQVAQTLQLAGIETQLDAQRGYDHGVFVPLKIMFPEADIPIIQVSLLRSLDADAHLRLGEALAGLAQNNILFVGSGFSFHNMRAFFNTSAAADAENMAFEAWLKETLCSDALTESERRLRFVHWEQAPSARFCHPREEHLLPLHVCYGLTQRACDDYDSVKVLGKNAGLFYWHSIAGSQPLGH